MKKLISIDELATNLGIAKETIYQWTSIKVIPFYKIGRLVRFDEQEIDKWLTERKQQISKFADEYWSAK
jgi:excisionase family DNA binding protein